MLSEPTEVRQMNEAIKILTNCVDYQVNGAVPVFQVQRALLLLKESRKRYDAK